MRAFVVEQCCTSPLWAQRWVQVTAVGKSLQVTTLRNSRLIFPVLLTQVVKHTHQQMHARATCSVLQSRSVTNYPVRHVWTQRTAHARVKSGLYKATSSQVGLTSTQQSRICMGVKCCFCVCEMRDCHSILILKHHASVTQNIKVSVFRSTTVIINADSDAMHTNICEKSSVFFTMSQWSIIFIAYFLIPF